VNLGALVFYFLALMILSSALYVALTKHVVRAGFALIAAFLGIAGLFAFLGADFLAGTQLLVYAGGILVLLLFGVMLTQHSFALHLPGQPARLSS
jgi:NADH-quinone oxidoreductase subunit J